MSNFGKVFNGAANIKKSLFNTSLCWDEVGRQFYIEYENGIILALKKVQGVRTYKWMDYTDEKFLVLLSKILDGFETSKFILFRTEPFPPNHLTCVTRTWGEYVWVERTITDGVEIYLLSNVF